MELRFFKYQGTGNDFILIDNRRGLVDEKDLELVKRLCHRKFGIGSDGLILIQEHGTYDFEMVFFNPDGSQSLCGNGSRCAVKFAQKLQLVQDHAHFLTIDGPLHGQIEGDTVRLEMNNVDHIEFIDRDIFLHNGSPHYLCFQNEVSKLDVLNLAREIRYSPRFKDSGTNVNFVQILSDNEIYNRTYERGVENETLSCGTGVVAASIGAHFHHVQSPVKVNTPGGQLTVEFTKTGETSFSNITLTGPAQLVFEGSITL